MKQILRNIIQSRHAAFLSLIEYIWKYLYTHLHQCIYFIVIAIVLFWITGLPYVNILVGRYVIYFILFVVAKYVFNIPAHHMLQITVSLFFLSGVFAVTGNTGSAELMGNLIYMLLWFNAFLYMKHLKDQP